MSSKVIKNKLNGMDKLRVKDAVDIHLSDLDIALARRLAVRYGLEGIAIGFGLGVILTAAVVFLWLH